MADIDEIKSKLDIVDVISGYVDLKHAGTNYKANCPFHSEKTPSFMVNPTLQIYKCFGCGKGGDVITFIQEIERLEFKEAIRVAAERAGVELNYSKPDKELEAKKSRILEANELTAKFYNYILKTHKLGKPGREYAQKRKLTGKEIEKFLFGFAPDTKTALKDFLLTRGFKVQELIDFGLLINREGKVIDKFRNRLMQPVRNPKGQVVAFSGRFITKSDYAPKYLNSPETLIYKKQETLYGLYEGGEAIRKQKNVIIVEGNIDIPSSHRVGIENIVAPLGTAFTPKQAALLKRYAEVIYFCFDSDTAGTNALIRSLKIVEEAEIKHRVIDLGEYQDADQLICMEKDSWSERIEQNRNTIEYLIEKFAEDLDLGSVEGKSEFKSRILPILRMLRDNVQISHFVKEVSLILEITQEELLKDVEGRNNKERFELQRKAKGSERKDKVLNPADVDVIETVPLTQVNKLEKYFMSLLVQNSFEKSFLTKFNPEVITSALLREIFEIVSELEGEINDDIIQTLDSAQVEIIKDLMLEDLTKVSDPKKVAKDVYSRLYKKYLQQEILKIRKEMSIKEDDSELLSRFNELSKSLKTIGTRD